jgi:hypothetical protein
MATWVNTLIFRGSAVGDYTLGVKSEPQRLSDPSIRAPLWRTAVRINDEYPAYYWRHTFKVYVEKASREAFAVDWYQMVETLVSSIGTLTLAANEITEVSTATGTLTTTPYLINYGTCAYQEQGLVKPGELILFRAGITELVFVGNLCPRPVE